DRFTSPDIKWITLPDSSGLKYQIVEAVPKPDLNPDNLLTQLFYREFKDFDKIRYGSSNVASKSELNAIRRKFKEQLAAAVDKGQIPVEKLIDFAQELYIKYYLPNVRNVSGLYYYAHTPRDFPAMSYIRDFYFDSHADVLSLVPSAAKLTKTTSDFRTLENQALDIIDRIGSYEYFQDFGTGIPRWAKNSSIRDAKRMATAILIDKAAQRLQQQILGLSLKELDMLLQEYSRRINIIEKRSVFWLENLGPKARASLTGLMVENKPEVGVPLAAFVLLMGDAFNSKLYSEDPMLLLYFRTMRAQVATILAQE
ncbi:MAG: hypothetical protein ACK5W9_06155, partial [Bdellovibrionales bacterium]